MKFFLHSLVSLLLLLLMFVFPRKFLKLLKWRISVNPPGPCWHTSHCCPIFLLNWLLTLLTTTVHIDLCHGPQWHCQKWFLCLNTAVHTVLLKDILPQMCKHKHYSHFWYSLCFILGFLNPNPGLGSDFSLI